MRAHLSPDACAQRVDVKAGNVHVERKKVFYRYRGKGGKVGRRELPRPSFETIVATLADAAKTVVMMVPEESLWQAGASERGVTGANFYGRFRRYFVEAGHAPTGVHVLRHTGSEPAPGRGPKHRIGEPIPRP